MQQYSSLNLADVYAVIAYYLQRREQVKEYLRERQQQAQQIRKENQTRFDARGVRECLLARRSGKRQ